MQTFEQNIIANTPWTVGVSGGFFRLLSGVGVEIIFWHNSREIGRANHMDSGYWAKVPDGFTSVTITPSVEQFIKIAISDGESGFDSAPIINGGSVPTIQNVVVVGSNINAVVLGQNAKKISIKSSSANTDALWVSFSGNPAVTPHFILNPGESWSESGILIGPGGITVTMYAPGVDVSAECITWI